MNNLSFKSYIVEAMSSGSSQQASFLIKKYLKKKTGLSFFSAGTEIYHNDSGRGYGIRFYDLKKNTSLRFNWESPSQIGLSHLVSVDFWNGESDAPYHIEFDKEVSLVKTLPIIADIVSSGGYTGEVSTMPDNVPLDEARGISPEEMFDGIIHALSDGEGVVKGTIQKEYGLPGRDIFNKILELYYDKKNPLIVKHGVNYFWIDDIEDTDIKKIKDNQEIIIASTGIVFGKISRGSAKETYDDNDEVKGIVKELERDSYKDQLADLRTLLKVTINKNSPNNALFITGKSGSSKTYTVEEVLDELGFKDGKGYFKNTGSVKPAGLYELLFRHKDDVILFDDSDSVFADVDSRNILKAATDDKKVRKLSWTISSKGSNIYNPEWDGDPEKGKTYNELIDANMFPLYFEFTGKIIFISNLTIPKLDPDGALRTRGYIVDINPTDAEIYDKMREIVGNLKLGDGFQLKMSDRLKVIDILTTSDEPANLRKLGRALNLAGHAINDSDSDEGLENNPSLRRLILKHA